jgi:hypothetical protein
MSESTHGYQALFVLHNNERNVYGFFFFVIEDTHRLKQTVDNLSLITLHRGDAYEFLSTVNS